MATFMRSLAACSEFIYTVVSIVRYNTRPCKRRLIRFGSGKAGIAAMAQPYRIKEAGAAPLQGQGHAAMSIHKLNFSFGNLLSALAGG